MCPQVVELVAVELEVSFRCFQRIYLLHRCGWPHFVDNEPGIGFLHVELVAVVSDHNISFVKQIPSGLHNFSVVLWVFAIQIEVGEGDYFRCFLSFPPV